MTRRHMRGAGWAILAVAAVTLAVNAASVARNWASLRPIARGDAARPFALPRADGSGSVALEGLRGQVVLIDFWATWCRPCRASMPAIQRVYNRFRERGLEVVSVNIEGAEATDKALAFAGRMGLTFPVVMDEPGPDSVATAYGASRIPYLVLVDHTGVVRAVHRGTSRNFEAELSSQVEGLIRSLP